METGLASPALTVALSLCAGMVSQAMAQHLRVPSIVLLLIVGVMLGPEVLGVVRPDLLGDGLLTLVGFAVATILFEGGMHLSFKRLRREGPSLHRLVTIGAALTVVGASLCAHHVLDWDVRPSVLFGTLVMVTGPTVVTPLLKRLQVEHRCATLLEAEGVVIDAIGAVVATVALQTALSPLDESDIALGILHVPAMLAFGGLVGLVGGYLLSLLLRFRPLVPAGLENVFSLSVLFAMFQASNACVPDTGVAAATVAGLVVGHVHRRGRRQLHRFKEQLTALFIGMLFVLLAADVSLDHVARLGMPGLVTVGLLIGVIRPLSVFVAMWGTDLSLRQRVFVGAVGPRGIVAAAVAAFFAEEMGRYGMAGGAQMRAMVFCVIFATVVFTALVGGPLARVLGLRRDLDRGFLVLGANALALVFARTAARFGEEVVCIDADPKQCSRAQAAGVRVVYGDGLREAVIARAGLSGRRAALALSTKTEANLLFVWRLRELGAQALYAAVGRSRDETAAKELEKAGASLLFGRPHQLDWWEARAREGLTPIALRLTSAFMQGVGQSHDWLGSLPQDLVLAIAWVRDGRLWPVGVPRSVEVSDSLIVAIDPKRQAAGFAALTRCGLQLDTSLEV